MIPRQSHCPAYLLKLSKSCLTAKLRKNEQRPWQALAQVTIRVAWLREMVSLANNSSTEQYDRVVSFIDGAQTRAPSQSRITDFLERCKCLVQDVVFVQLC